jgi:hypothetical protein
VPSQGEDGLEGTADDVTLLVTNVGETPQVTAISTPFLSTESSTLVRLSPTRAVVATGGPDGTFATLDDRVLLLDTIGSLNVVTNITIPFLGESNCCTPVQVAPDTLAVTTVGMDRTPLTHDDQVAVITRLGGANTVTLVTAGWLQGSGASRPVPLSQTSLLVTAYVPPRLPQCGADASKICGPRATNAGADCTVLEDCIGDDCRGGPGSLCGVDLDCGESGTNLCETQPQCSVDSSKICGPDTVPNEDKPKGPGDDCTANSECNGDKCINVVGTVCLADADCGTTGTCDFQDRCTPSFDVGPNAVCDSDGDCTEAGSVCEPFPSPLDSADTVYLFTGLGSVNDRTDLPTPHAYTRRPGRAERFSDTRAMISSNGPDGIDESGDEQVYLLDNLGSTNDVTAISVPNIYGRGAGSVVSLTEGDALVTTLGPDGANLTDDDTVVLISDLGGSNTTTAITVGPADQDLECRSVPVSPTSAALITFGTDRTANTADDHVTLVSGIGTANTVTHVDVPGLADGSTSTISRITSSTLMVASGGADGTSGAGGDDAMAIVSNLDVAGAPKTQFLPSGGDYDSARSFGYAPENLGGGRAIHLASGANHTLGSGDDDAVRVIEGLADAPAILRVQKMKIDFKPNKPQKGDKAKVQASLKFEGPVPFGDSDVVITIGNAAQTIPSSRFEEKKGEFSYEDKKGENGFIRQVNYNSKSKKGKLKVKAKGVGTGLRTTSASYLAFALEFLDNDEFISGFDDLDLCHAVVGKSKKEGRIQYKAR